ncbi:MAG TPA: GldG family protein [Anaerolineales bacterium]
MARKKKPAQRYAALALVFAGLACAATVLLGLVQGIVALQMFTPTNPDSLTRALQVSAMLVIAGIAVYGILAPDNVRRFFGGRQARYGSNALVMSVAVLAILVAVNVVAFQNPHQIAELTEDKSHTLAPETLHALASLPEKVTALAFYSVRLPSANAESLLRDFKANSQGKFDYQFVDPDVDPVKARQYGITGDGKIMLVMGTQKEIASSATESELTRSLIRLLSPEQRTVYFLTGHGEPDIADSGNGNLSLARATLESKNYIVKTLNLLAENKIPDDAQAIVIAGPTKPLSYLEITLLQKYLQAGGGLVVMEDPLPLTDFGSDPDPLAAYLSSAWAITLDNDMIIDLTNTGQELYATAASHDPEHPIVRTMTRVAILPQARSLSVGESPADVTVTPLIFTSTQSWGETDLENLSGQVKLDAGVDTPGPLVLAAAAENTSTQGRVVVFGNSIFATDQAFDAYGNGDIFVSSVDWAAQQENLIQITPHQKIDRSFNIPGQLQMLSILLGSIFILPGMVLVAGISAWLARRRQG